MKDNFIQLYVVNAVFDTKQIALFSGRLDGLYGAKLVFDDQEMAALCAQNANSTVTPFTLVVTGEQDVDSSETDHIRSTRDGQDNDVASNNGAGAQDDPAE